MELLQSSKLDSVTFDTFEKKQIYHNLYNPGLQKKAVRNCDFSLYEEFGSTD
jgi:hypothetical protein